MKARVLFLIPVFCFGFLSPIEADEKLTIGPIEKTEDISLTLLDGHGWHKASSLGEHGRTVQMSYVRGFWDALALFDLACPAMNELRQDYQGMTVSQILDTINKFYGDNPQWQEWPPALVMWHVIPRLRKGLSPVDSSVFQREP